MALQNNINENKTNENASESYPGQIFTVPTMKDKTVKTLDESSLKTSSDLEALKARDPFMYYSIPAVKEAVMQGKPLDLEAKALAQGNRGGSSTVERRTRVSFESYDIESLTGMMAGAGCLEDDGEDDLYSSFLAMHTL